MLTFLPHHKPEESVVYSGHMLHVVVWFDGVPRIELETILFAVYQTSRSYPTFTKEAFSSLIEEHHLTGKKGYIALLSDHNLSVYVGLHTHLKLQREGTWYDTGLSEHVFHGIAQVGDVIEVVVDNMPTSKLALDIVALADTLAEEEEEVGLPTPLAPKSEQSVPVVLPHQHSPAPQVTYYDDPGEDEMPQDDQVYEEPTGNKNARIGWIVVASLFALMLIGALVWGVRLNQQKQAFIKTQQDVDDLLKKAVEAAPVNSTQAQQLYAQAQQVFEQGKVKAISSQKADVEALATKIVSLKDTVNNSVKASPDVFFDPTLDDKTFSGLNLAVAGNTGYVLGKQGALYEVALPSKSFQKKTNVPSDAQRIVAVGKTLLAHSPEKGIVEVASGNEVKIAAEKLPKTVGPLCTYKGNVYIVDTEASDVRKFVPLGTGFSNGTSYFPGKSPSGITDCAINGTGSLFMIADGKLLVYRQGVKDTSFTLSQDEQGLTGVRILPSGNVALINAPKGTVHLFSEKGEYKKEVTSAFLTGSTAVEPWSTGLLILNGSKLYNLALE